MSLWHVLVWGYILAWPGLRSSSQQFFAFCLIALVSTLSSPLEVGSMSELSWSLHMPKRSWTVFTVYFFVLLNPTTSSRFVSVLIICTFSFILYTRESRGGFCSWWQIDLVFWMHLSNDYFWMHGKSTSWYHYLCDWNLRLWNCLASCDSGLSFSYIMNILDVRDFGAHWRFDLLLVVVVPKWEQFFVSSRFVIPCCWGLKNGEHQLWTLDESPTRWEGNTHVWCRSRRDGRWPLSCLVLSGMGLREWGDKFSSFFIGSERAFLSEFSVSIGSRWKFFIGESFS